MNEIEELMAGLDAPVALPSGLRTRLTNALGETGGEEPLLVGLDAPQDLPAAHRERLAAAISAAIASGATAPIRPRPAMQRWLALAAAAIVLIAGTTVALRSNHHTSVKTTAGALAAGPATTSGPSAFNQIPPASTPLQATSGGSAGAAASGSTPPASPKAADSTMAGGAAMASGGEGSPPPFAEGAGAASMPATASPQPPQPPPPAPVTVVAVGGDSAEQSGFNAYVGQLNQSQARHFNVVTTPTKGAVATVNLSDAPLAPGTQGPVLETQAVPERILRSPVFDATSAPAHQGAVAVAVMFPNLSPGKVATVYRGTQSVYATDVTDAITAALQKRDVTSVVVTYTPGQPFKAGPGDAAFLALDTADARAWLADAARVHYHPALGVIGISSLVEPSLLASLPDGTRAVGAYDLPAGGEQATLASAIGREPGMSEVHGWVTAKLLAVALWRSGATTPAATTTALSQMVGYPYGFGPAIAFRPGTTSRTPDGVLFTVTGHAFATNHKFAADGG